MRGKGKRKTVQGGLSPDCVGGVIWKGGGGKKEGRGYSDRRNFDGGTLEGRSCTDMQIPENEEMQGNLAYYARLFLLYGYSRGL